MKIQCSKILLKANKAEEVLPAKLLMQVQIEQLNLAESKLAEWKEHQKLN